MTGGNDLSERRTGSRGFDLGPRRSLADFLGPTQGTIYPLSGPNRVIAAEIYEL